MKSIKKQTYQKPDNMFKWIPTPKHFPYKVFKFQTKPSSGYNSSKILHLMLVRFYIDT